MKFLTAHKQLFDRVSNQLMRNYQNIKTETLKRGSLKKKFKVGFKLEIKLDSTLTALKFKTEYSDPNLKSTLQNELKNIL